MVPIDIGKLNLNIIRHNNIKEQSKIENFLIM